LQPGERIVAIDGVPWEQFSSLDEAILAIIGEAGTEVVLTVRSLDDVEREVSITRAVVDLEKAVIQAAVIEGTKIGLLTLNGFDSPEIPGLVRDTLVELMASGALDGLIVDVRANLGGTYEAFLGTLAPSIDGGSVGRNVGREEAEDFLIPEGKTIPELEGLPIVLLTGPHTVSGAEVFAAGMQLLSAPRSSACPLQETQRPRSPILCRMGRCCALPKGSISFQMVR